MGIIAVVWVVGPDVKGLVKLHDFEMELRDVMATKLRNLQVEVYIKM